MKQVESAIIKTLVYADIFNFPLTESELWRYLLIKKIKLANFHTSIEALRQKKLIYWRNNFYILCRRQAIIGIRIHQQRYVKRKLKIAQKATALLKFIPWVWFIGITGSLAIGNSQKEDDIDLMIVTAPNTMWLTRLLTIIILDIFGLRRTYGQVDTRDRICVNMFFDSRYLAVSQNQRDIYIAHEIAQLKPLLNRHFIYEIFLQKNMWVKAFLPHALTIANIKIKVPIFKSKILIYLNQIAKTIQMMIMKQKITTETITDKYLRFHPQDAREWILLSYKEKLAQYLKK